MLFAKYVFQTILFRVASIVIGLFSGIITARSVGVEGVGILALLFLIPDLAFRFGNMGFGSAFAYYIAKDKISARKALQLIWSVGSLGSIISILAILTIWQQDFSPWKDIQPNLFFLYLITIPLLFYNNFLQRLLVGLFKITESNIFGVITTYSHFALLLILVVGLKLDVLGVSLAVLSRDLIGLCYLYWRTRKHCHQEVVHCNYVKEDLTLSSLWNYGKWNYLIMFSNFFINELPLILLNKLSAGTVPIGLFSKARDLGNQTNIIVESITTVLFPFAASSNEKDGTDMTNKLCRNFLFFISFIIIFVIILIKPIIGFLYGRDFVPAAEIFYVMAPAFISWPIGRFLGIHVAAIGFPKGVFFTGCCAFVIVLPISWFLISELGATGAGLGASLMFVTWSILRLFLYIRVTKTNVVKVLIPQKEDFKDYLIFIYLIAKKIKNIYHHPEAK